MDKNKSKFETMYKILCNLIDNDENSGKYFETITRLFDTKKLSLNETDKLANDMIDFVKYCVSLLASCPEIKITKKRSSHGKI